MECVCFVCVCVSESANRQKKRIKCANYGHKHKPMALLVLKEKAKFSMQKYSAIFFYILSLIEVGLCGSSKLNRQGVRNELVNTVHIFRLC